MILIILAFNLFAVIFDALNQELNRSITNLKFEDYPPPYYISYQLKEVKTFNIQYKYGSLLRKDENHYRYLTPIVRVGDYEFDNSEELNYISGGGYLPLEDDLLALRHAIWLVTDNEYKKAAKQFLSKKAKNITEFKEEIFPDFSKEPTYYFIMNSPEGGETDDLSEKTSPLEDYLLELSKKFEKENEILDSDVSMSIWKIKRYFLSNEGTKIKDYKNVISVSFSIFGLSENNKPISLNRTYYANNFDKLPQREVLNKITDELIPKFKQLKKSKEGDPMTAPAILDPYSSGVLFHEAIGHRLEGDRQRVQEEGQTFRNELGKKIIPEFLTVIDDPTLTEFNNISLNGHYLYDDEGVKSQRVVVVEDGKLINFLMSRKPFRKFTHSNGHGRMSSGYTPMSRMANFIVKSKKEYPLKELKKKLLEICNKKNKPYGLIIKRMRSGDTFTKKGGYQAFRGNPEEVYLVDKKTGEEKLIRGVEVVGTPLITVNKIIATGNDYEVYNGGCSAESGWIFVSMIAPSILVEELEMQRTTEESQRPPILPHPNSE